MIDLHLHTTASDGRCRPTELITRLQTAGVTTFAITDHDTLAGSVEAQPYAERLGLTLVPGLEVTAVWGGRDVHVLGYWVDVEHAQLHAFLGAQRARRVERLVAIGSALAHAGVSVDVEPLLRSVEVRPGASIGRPAMAQALVDAGHASSVQDAFERWLGEGRPGYVPRKGVAPEEVFHIIHASGGLASLAHPGVTRRDEMIATWARAGLDAIEAYHSDHSEAEQALYVERARQLGLAVTGGSDFHGDDPQSFRARRRTIGGVSLPDADWQVLAARVPPRSS